MATSDLTLISHPLCPYVQRAAISLAEKGVPFRRLTVDLANKPAWFVALSPLGKTPVLKVGERPIFESAVILEYLEDTEAPPLHPSDALERAEHRAWIEFGSAVLNDIAGFYAAKDAAAFTAKVQALRGRFERLEAQLGEGPFFAGQQFSLVDAVFGPVFRYFDVFDQIDDFRILADLPRITRWRRALSERPSVRTAVTEDYNKRLEHFLFSRGSELSRRMTSHPVSA